MRPRRKEGGRAVLTCSDLDAFYISSHTVSVASSSTHTPSLFTLVAEKRIFFVVEGWRTGGPLVRFPNLLYGTFMLVGEPD